MRRWIARALRGVLLVGVGLLICLSPQPSEAAMQSPPLRLVRSTPDSVLLEFTLPAYRLEPVSVQGERYVRISVDGLSTGGEAGAPQLPQVGALIGLPTEGQASLRILAVEEARVSLLHPVYPEPIPMFDRETMGAGLEDVDLSLDGWSYKVARDPVVYGQNELYPGRFVELGKPGWVRDYRVARVTVSPVQYDPQRSELVLAKRMVVEILFAGRAPGAPAGALGTPSLAFERLLGDSVLNFETARNWRRSPASAPGPVEALANPLAGEAGSYKVEVEQDGLHRLTYADLGAAGVPVNGLDPRTLQLYAGDQEISIQVTGEQDGSFDSGDALLFYGQAPESRYTERNVYWLRFGARRGLRISTRSLVSASAPYSPTWTTARYSEAHYYDPLYAGVDGDHWYAADLRAGTSQSFAVPLMSPSRDSPAALLRLHVQGYTQSSSVHPDHHLVVQVNGRAAGDLWWDGKSAVSRDLTLDTAVLRTGANTVTLSVPGDTGTPVEGAWLDAIELDYPLQGVVGDEVQAVIEPGIQSYAIGGFSSAEPWVYDVTDPHHPIRLKGAALGGASGSYSLAFADVTLRPENYYVVVETQIHTPVALVADRPSTLRTQANGADYLIIAHPDLVDAIQPLASLRRVQGLRVAVVDVQDVYDEFSGGLLDPEAIRSFIAYAYRHWTMPAPTYVLLVGDGHYDFLDHYGYGAPNLIPPYLGMVDPWWGETAADNRYAAVSGEDNLPDVMLGRLPVTNAGEAAVVVGKIVHYERNPLPGDWNTRHVFVADDADFSGDFRGPLDAVYGDYISEPWRGQRIYLDELPVERAQEETLAAWQRGALLISYMGHSSWHQWAAEPLFDIHNVPYLGNHRQWPVVLSMTCFTGFFHHPEYGTLDEMLLRLNGGGAIATWSPSGLGVHSGHEELYRAFYEAVFQNSREQLGAAVLAAKLDFYANVYGHDDLLDTYHLFGDPAMILNLDVRSWPHSIYLPVSYKSSMGG